MAFPITAKGSLEIRLGDQPDRQQVAQHFVWAIEDEEPRDVRLAGNTIYFRAGPFRLVHSWNLLAPISTGKISIDQLGVTLRIKYKINFAELLVLSSVFGILFLMFNRAIGSDFGSMWLAILFGACFFSFNYLVAHFRFSSFLRAVADNVVDNKASLQRPPQTRVV